MRNPNPARRSYRRDTVERFRSHKLAVAGVVFFALELLLVVALPMLMGLDPNTSDPTAFGAAPGAGHLLGTDDIGRDVFARVVYGGRISLLVGVLSTFVSALIGVPLGLLAGYYRGAAEMIIMRLAEIFMSFPSMMLILVLVSLVGPSVWTVTVVIGVLGWPGFSKLLYANVLATREKEYITASRAVGTRDIAIMAGDIAPNSLSPVLVAFTFRIAGAIIQESSLSFLGMGVQPPQASWGNILYDAQSITVLSSMPWRWLPTGILLVLTVCSINFVGDGLRDALDSKQAIRRI